MVVAYTARRNSIRHDCADARAMSTPTPPLSEPARPKFEKLSIVIPVYNEEATVQELVRLVIASVLPAHLKRQIICVNDCSKDGTATKLDELPALFPGEEFKIV